MTSPLNKLYGKVHEWALKKQEKCLNQPDSLRFRFYRQILMYTI